MVLADLEKNIKNLTDAPAKTKKERGITSFVIKYFGHIVTTL